MSRINPAKTPPRRGDAEGVGLVLVESASLICSPDIVKTTPPAQVFTRT
jgi:hypothetical protein